jgi:hypothetical protein
MLADLHKKHPLLIHILIVCVAILVMRSVSEKRQLSHLYFMFFIIGLFGFMFVGIGSKSYSLILIVVSVALIYGMFQAHSNESSNAIYMTNKVLGLVGLMIGLGMVYNTFAPSIDEIANRGGWPGFIINFIFYLPCLISDFATYLKIQFGLTPSATYLLLGLEILLILTVVYLPRIGTKTHDATVLLSDARLDEPRVIASSFSRDRSYSFSMWIYTNQQPQKQDCNIFRYGSVSDGMRTPKYNLNPRLRDEMTIEEVKQEILAANPQSYLLDGKTDVELKTKVRELTLEDNDIIDLLKQAHEKRTGKKDYPSDETLLINYILELDGNALTFVQQKREKLMRDLSDMYDAQTQVKPQIKYISSSKGNDNFRIIAGSRGSYDVSIRSQKWNNFVVSYDGTQVDIFVNGHLERSAQLDAPIRYSPLDQVVVGDENGIDGAICNVCFFARPMTSFEIANTYNLLSSKNPPL